MLDGPYFFLSKDPSLEDPSAQQSSSATGLQRTLPWAGVSHTFTNDLHEAFILSADDTKLEEMASILDDKDLDRPEQGAEMNSRSQEERPSSAFIWETERHKNRMRGGLAWQGHP